MPSWEQEPHAMEGHHTIPAGLNPLHDRQRHATLFKTSANAFIGQGADSEPYYAVLGRPSSPSLADLRHQVRSAVSSRANGRCSAPSPHWITSSSPPLC